MSASTPALASGSIDAAMSADHGTRFAAAETAGVHKAYFERAAKAGVTDRELADTRGFGVSGYIELRSVGLDHHMAMQRSKRIGSDRSTSLAEMVGNGADVAEIDQVDELEDRHGDQWAPLGNQAEMRAAGASTADIVDAHTNGIPAADYAVARSVDKVTHKQVVAAYNAGIWANDYGRARRVATHKEAIELLGGGSNLRLRRYVNERLNGADHNAAMQ